MNTFVAQPRYSLIAQRLLQDIAAGKYPVGTLLPPEPELSSRFGVARNTIRQALGVLQDMGLVTPRRGVGTLVRAAAAEPRYVHSVDSLASLFAYVQETELQVISTQEIAAKGSLCDLLRCPPGRKWVMSEIIRYQRKDRLPISYSSMYVPEIFAGMIEHMNGLREPSYSLLEKLYGQRVLEVEQHASVGTIPAKGARHLNVRAGTPAQHVVRHYLGEEQAVLLASTSAYPAGRFTFSLHLRLVGPGKPG